MKGKRRIYLALVSLVLVLATVSCSTKKNKWYNRAYHTTVAHYNAYWNGNEALKEGVKTINTKQKDDYSYVIPIYKNPTLENATAVKPNMERSIEKASKVIKKHSMFIDKKERNPEIKKAYLMIGKASFYKKDFKTAQATFKYLVTAYKNKPIMYEAMIWLAFSYSADKDYSMAETTLDQVINYLQEKKCPRRYAKFLYSVCTDNALAQKKYDRAFQYLKLTEANSNPFNSFYTRLMFIEAQLYKQSNELEKAAYLFSKVAGRSKDYDMEFTSRINQATCYNPKKQSSKKIIASLEKMSVTDKNIEYRDQIYYALGEIYFKDRNVDKACVYWKQSVSSSVDNKNQKISSALRVADVNYTLLEKYDIANDYYDTALVSMKIDYPDYDNIKAKQRVLDNLVSNMRIVQRADSLLALSELPQTELDKKIEGWIKEYKRIQEEKRKKEAEEKALLAAIAASGSNNNRFNTTSSWYFYNVTTVQAGKNDFIKKWGQRELEDNWRLSDKQQAFNFVSMNDTASEATEENAGDSLSTTEKRKDSKGVRSNNPETKEYYTQDIPRTQTAKDSLNVGIAKALLNEGYIYYQGINNNDKAIETFLELQKRYPNDLYYPTTLPSSYHLYCIYDKIGQTPNANYYKNIVLNQYSNSEFAMIIKNPDYFSQLQKNNSYGERLYKEVYDTYNSHNYNLAIQKSVSAISTLKIGGYIPRLLYVEAISKGKLYGIDSLMSSLNMIVYNYPNDSITPIIDAQLKYLSANYNFVSQNMAYVSSGSLPQGNGENTLKSSKSDTTKTDVSKIIVPTFNDEDILDAESLVYRYRNMEHFFVLLFDDDKVNSSDIKRKFSDFNAASYSAVGLSITSLLFTMDKQMISVARFEDIEMAMEYYKSVLSSDILSGVPSSSYTAFVISTQNYPTFYSRKNLAAYMKFFRIFYLKPLAKKN